MKEEQAENIKKKSIKVPRSGEEFLVDGFADAYEVFLEEKPSRRPREDSSGVIIMMLGAILTLVAFSSVLFDFGSGDGARILGAVGALVSIGGAKLQQDARGISPEQFFSDEYNPTEEDGLRLGGSCFEYLGESRFLVR